MMLPQVCPLYEILDDDIVILESNITPSTIPQASTHRTRFSYRNRNNSLHLNLV